VAKSAPDIIQINNPSLNVEKCELNKLVIDIAIIADIPMVLNEFVTCC
jgi:hypothetical protein